MQLEIFWETPRTQLGALLLDLFSYYNAFFLQYPTFILKDSATGYSNITTDLMTEPELDSSSLSHNTDDN